jgi:hypothetical protein
MQHLPARCDGGQMRRALDCWGWTSNARQMQGPAAPAIGEAGGDSGQQTRLCTGTCSRGSSQGMHGVVDPGSQQPLQVRRQGVMGGRTDQEKG